RIVRARATARRHRRAPRPRGRQRQVRRVKLSSSSWQTHSGGLAGVLILTHWGLVAGGWRLGFLLNPQARVPNPGSDVVADEPLGDADRLLGPVALHGCGPGRLQRSA